MKFVSRFIKNRFIKYYHLFQKGNRFRLKREVSFVRSSRIVVMTSALVLRLLRTVIIITIIIEVALLK